MIAGIILAAGASRRMGQPKQLLPLAGKPMVWHVATAACQSSLDAVFLVTGAGADAVRTAVKELPLTCIQNENWEAGQSGSVTTGLKELAPDTKAVMFLLADQPLITPELIDALINAYHRSTQSIICPCHAGQRGNPVLFGYREWKSSLCQLSGDQGARQIIAGHPEALLQVPVDSAKFFWDVDTEADYQRVSNELSRRDVSGENR